MIPSFIGPAPVSPVSSSHRFHHQHHLDAAAAARVVVWAGDNAAAAAVPAFLGVDLNADAASCSSISGCNDDGDDAASMMDDVGNDRELECLISFDDDSEDSDMADDDDLLLNRHHDITPAAVGTEVFTPYPFDRQTKEEIENFRQLGLSFGEDWSLQLADEVTCSEGMSIAPMNDDFDAGDFDSPPLLPPQTVMNSNDGSATTLGLDESDEVKAMRNRLWKQSLKTSMFTSLQSCKR